MVRNHNENRERIRNQAHHRFNPSTGGCLVRWRPVGLGVVAVVASSRVQAWQDKHQANDVDRRRRPTLPT